MASTGQLGQALYGVAPDTVIPNLVVDAPTTLELGAGEIGGFPVKATPFLYAVCPHDTANDGKVGGWCNYHALSRKTTGAGITAFTFLTLVAVGSQDYFAYRTAVSGEDIHGIAMEDAASGDTMLHVLGPFMPPFSAV
jgi:hypothetical protein